MSQYRKIDMLNLEQNLYWEFVNLLHNTLMDEIVKAGIIKSTDIKKLSETIKNNYTKDIMEEIKGFAVLS